MQFEINPQTVITCAAVISALGVIYGFFRKMQKFIDKHEKNTQDIKEVKRDDTKERYRESIRAKLEQETVKIKIKK